jgi:hypothetical protein
MSSLTPKWAVSCKFTANRTITWHMHLKENKPLQFNRRFSNNNYPRSKFMVEIGRAIAQAVSRRLATAAARVRARVRSCGICGGQSGTGAGFLWVLRFPLPFSFHRLFLTHHLSSGAGTIGQLVADVSSGHSLTPSQEKKIIVPTEYGVHLNFHGKGQLPIQLHSRRTPSNLLYN